MNFQLVSVSCCLFFALLGAAMAVMRVGGVVGGDATVRCTVARNLSLNHTKFLCKRQCLQDKHVVAVNSNETSIHQMGRYILHDTPDGVFYVTITGLTKEDSGRYWCGVSLDGYNLTRIEEVFLTVVEASAKEEKTSVLLLPFFVVVLSVSIAVSVGLTVFLCRRWTTGQGPERMNTGGASLAADYMNSGREPDPTYQTLDPATMNQDQIYSSV